MRKKTFIISTLVVTMAMSCSTSESNEERSNAQTPDSSSANASTLSDEELNNIIESIPSPVEFSSLIESSGAKYDEAYLNSTENSAGYNSQFSKAVNLGIYGADLGYVNMYEKTFSAMSYLNTVYKLSTDLNIGGYFDFETLKRLATNNRNLDSIVYITTKSFESMHRQLKASGNSEISTLILIGGWVEGMHLASSIVKSSQNSPEMDNLMLTVYDEHIVLDDIIILANAYKSNPYFKNTIENLQGLKKVLNKIKEDGSGNKISKEQFELIAKEIAKIRTELIK